MQQYLETAPTGFFGDDLRIGKMWKNSEGYRHGKRQEGFRGSALIAEIVDNYRQPWRCGVSGGSASCAYGRGRLAQGNDDLDHLGSLPRALIIETDEIRRAVPRDAPEAVGACNPIKLIFERGD
jgi:hypothetical protein